MNSPQSGVKPVTGMKVKITPKKVNKTRPRTLVHGEPGVGKSTFAANAPNVVFICVEQGTDNIAVARARVEDASHPEGERDPRTLEEVFYILDSLVAGVQASIQAKQPLPFENLAIDTLDALESFIWAHLCRIGNKRSIADFKFGSGFDKTVDEFKHIQRRLEQLRDMGIGIILLAHTKTDNFSNPEGQDYNYYEIKLHKKVAGLFVEWCDNVLYARREQYALEEGGKVRGVGSGARFLCTQKTPAYVAKNRYDLPERLPLSWDEYQKGMDNHKPGDPEELMTHAKLLIQQLDKETQIQATAALSKISKEDSKALTQFVDFCRSKVVLSGTNQEKTQ